MNALARVDFFNTVTFLFTNKLTQAALGNWAIVMEIGLGKLMCKLFLGTLRDIEVEVRGQKDLQHRRRCCWYSSAHEQQTREAYFSQFSRVARVLHSGGPRSAS